MPLAGAALALLALPGLIPDRPAEAAEPKDVVSLSALHQQWIQDQIWCGLGEVEISYQDIKMRADEVSVDLATMHLQAAGSVVLDQGSSRLACSRLDFDLRAKTGTLYDVDAFLPPIYHFRGEVLEKLDPTHYRFHRGLFTSCSLEKGAPPWSIEMQDAMIELEGYGHFRGASIEVKGVPVFYTPRLLWPVKRDRAAGLLVPSFGNNSRQGTYLGNSYYWPISRSLDTTFFLDLYSKGMIGLADEFRLAPAENAKGIFTFETLRDPDTGVWEWKIKGRYAQLFPGGYSIRSEVAENSNADFFQAFERTNEQQYQNRSLYSHVTATRVWGPQTVNFKIDHLRTFFSATTATTDTTEVVLDREPELEYRLRSTRIGMTPFYVSAVGVLDQLYMDRPSPPVYGRYQRADFFPQLTILTSGLPWLSFSPTIGARETFYTKQYELSRFHQPIGLLDQSMSRNYWTGGVTLVGPSFSRVWELESGTKIKHLIEPRAEYSYVSNPGISTAIPVFDERDSVVVANQARYTLANRIFVKSGQSAREVASLEITQTQSFSDPIVIGYGGMSDSYRGPLSFWLRASPVIGSSLDARVDVHPVTHKIESSSLSGGTFGTYGSLGLTWFSSYNPLTSEVQSSQSRVFWALGPATVHWRVEGSVAYDIHNRMALDQRYILRWRGSCWSIVGEFRDYRQQPYPNRSYRISIDLTGIGTLLDIKGGLDTGH
jgi:LPS-assembly protein